MKARLVRIGNSRGVRLPKPLIEEAGLEDDVELLGTVGFARLSLSGLAMNIIINQQLHTIPRCHRTVGFDDGGVRRWDYCGICYGENKAHVMDRFAVTRIRSRRRAYPSRYRGETMDSLPGTINTG